MEAHFRFRDLREERERKQLHSLLITLVFFICFGIISLCSGCWQPARAEVDLSIIKQIESGGNPLVISKTGAIGLFQIMPCVLQEYNQFNKTNHTRQDLFNPLINEQIASWYLNKRIPQMLKHYKKEVNTTNQIIAYNAGIRAVVKGYLPLETKNYLAKYARLSQ